MFKVNAFSKKPVAIRRVTTSQRVVSQSQVIRKTAGFALFFVLITSFAPNVAFSDSDYAFDQTAYPMVSSTIVADDAGFMVPVNPQTGKSDRSEMTDKAVHIVESGETLSLIAETYGLETQTLRWENNLSKNATLKVGKKLVIPPVNGVSHKVKSGQTVAKIAGIYDVEASDILKQNGITDGKLRVGQEIFVPGGEQIAPPKPVVTPTSSTRSIATQTSSATRVDLQNSTAAPTAGKFLIVPTRGTVTQGYYSWHRAVDLADRSKPPVWAAAAGTVVKASSGTWGGGYGNYVIIDHGNGVQTLYAHLDYLTVSKGQYVSQGEVIGRMGNTGRVYGVTGIHLHFEVRDHGVKRVPSYYW